MDNESSEIEELEKTIGDAIDDDSLEDMLKGDTPDPASAEAEANVKAEAAANANGEAANAEANAEANANDDGDGTGDTPTQSAESKTDDGESGAEGGEKPKGVLAKDEENIIPYEVLEQTRKRATDAEAQIKSEAEARQKVEADLAALQQKVAAMEQGGTATEAEKQAADEAAGDLEKMLSGLDEDEYGPEMVAFLKKVSSHVTQVNAQLHSTQEELNSVKTKAQQQEDAAVVEEVKKVQSLIDSNANLSTWQAEAGDKWDAALKHDAALLNSPGWKDKPDAERFAEVERRVQSDFGLEVTVTQDAGKESNDGDGGDAEAKAKADAEANAGGKKPVTPKPDDGPTSLSDIPGGSTPSQSGAIELDNMSPVAMHNTMDRLSNEQIDELLSR